MICPQCKSGVADAINFCPNCGTPKAKFLPGGTFAPHQPASPILAPVQISPAVLQALFLRPGERAVGVWRAGYVLPDRSFDDEEASTPMTPGILVASDQRLIFVQEKGILNKSYRPMDSMELRQITGHRITSLLRMKELEVELQDQKGRRKQRFSNLYEIDPLSLKPLRPSTPDEARSFFGNLIGAR